MSFLLPCPECGERSAYEFRFGGEVKSRPQPGASEDAWFQYIYTKANEAGEQKEWWFHRNGCRKWFQALRDTRTNTVLATWRPES
jgi:heterotetrameric sarcosine oxidase delta subunit